MVRPAGNPCLGEILIRAGQATAEQVEEGLKQQQASGERLGRCLLELGYISEETLLQSLAEQMQLLQLPSDQLTATPAATNLLDAEFVRRSEILPLAIRDGKLQIATADPGNRQVIEDVRLLSGCEVEEVVAEREQIRGKIQEAYAVTVENVIGDFTSSNSDERSDTLHEIEVMANEPTVVNLVNVIISSALRERASDIHLVPFERSLELRYRIDGVLQVMSPPPRHLHAALISRIKIMAQINIAERYVPQDGHFQIQHDAQRVDVRVGTMPTVYGESVVMRLLVKDSRTQTLAELGMHPDEAGRLHDIVSKPYGILLSTGPTGCGKTTTLYAILSGIYSPERKTLTIEDPVEYELQGVAQIPVRPSRGFTFASGLRAILRQDPDVIMVGEIRDAETAEIAIRAALTGHLVFSTLHTNDAPGAITRLLDMGIEAFLISSSLEGVLAQRLVRRICPQCKSEVQVDADVDFQLTRLGISPSEGPFYLGSGCEACRGTGYLGRTGLFELLVLRPELRQLVVERRSSSELRSRAIEHMRTIRDDGLAKLRDGTTTISEVLRVTVTEQVE